MEKNYSRLIALLEDSVASDSGQPKSPQVHEIEWAKQTYPGDGPDDPDVFYPRKHPQHVLGKRS